MCVTDNRVEWSGVVLVGMGREDGGRVRNEAKRPRGKFTACIFHSVRIYCVSQKLKKSVQASVYALQYALAQSLLYVCVFLCVCVCVCVD